MLVPYYQMNAFILNSYKPVYPELIKYRPKITFENYIKSQLHTNIVTGLYNRDIIKYFKALQFINSSDNSDEGYSAYMEVLKLYYTDIGNSMLKCIGSVSEDFSVIDTDIPKSRLLEKETINIDEVYNDLIDILVNNKTVTNSKIDYLEMLKEIPLEVFTELKPTKLLAEALIYIHYGKENKTYRLEVVS